MSDTPAKYIKSEGLPSLQYVADKSQTKRDTLARWFITRPGRFRVVVRGVKEEMIDSDRKELK